MDNKRLLAKLLKTHTSLGNHIHAGKYYRGMGNARTVDLVDRYNDLKDEAVTAGIWDEYCEITGTSRYADAYDFLA